MTRHPAMIQRDLEQLGPDPTHVHHQAKAALEAELAATAAEHAARLAAYRELRAHVESEIRTYASMAREIIRALHPILEMMRQHKALDERLDDAMDRVISEAATLRCTEGPPKRERMRWPEFVAGELRRGQRL